MAKISANYEVVYIIDPAQGEEAVAAIVAKFQALAEQHGCSDVVVDEWGKRRLAYAVKKFTDGFYVLINFEAAPAEIKEIDRVLKINDEVLRHLIVKHEA
jgi:small subunit ribosomal protein S6